MVSKNSMYMFLISKNRSSTSLLTISATERVSHHKERISHLFITHIGCIPLTVEGNSFPLSLQKRQKWRVKGFRPCGGRIYPRISEGLLISISISIGPISFCDVPRHERQMLLFKYEDNDARIVTLWRRAASPCPRCQQCQRCSRPTDTRHGVTTGNTIFLFSNYLETVRFVLVVRTLCAAWYWFTLIKIHIRRVSEWYVPRNPRGWFFMQILRKMLLLIFH